jgi:hypothetical protein
MTLPQGGVERRIILPCGNPRNCLERGCYHRSMISDEPRHASRRSSPLGTLLCFWTLRDAAQPATSTRASCCLLGVWLALWIVYDRWQAGPDALFVAQGVPLFAWYMAAALGLAAWLRRRCAPAPSFGAAFGLVAGLIPVPLLVATVGYAYLDDRWLLGAAVLAGVYGLLYLLRGLSSLTGAPQRLAAFSGLGVLVGFIWLSDALDAIPDVWAPVEIEPAVASTDNSPADAESLLFAQQSKIDRALASIDHGSSPGGDAFFLGFAGVGEEKVFAQEIQLASRVIGMRFPVGDRSLSLLNDARDLESAPLASLAALRYALRGLAAKMNLDRDVLFLSISSHGSQDPAIAVSNADLPFNDLTDEDLGQALQQSGIKWRVIIVSACYAGGFIEALKNPQTIIIAAAAADRTSFGCGSDSDLTYFGEAFYRDALPGAPSLRAAFEQAKAAIAQRERREHVDASRPEAYFGVELAKKLTHLTQNPAR